MKRGSGEGRRFLTHKGPRRQMHANPVLELHCDLLVGLFVPTLPDLHSRIAQSGQATHFAVPEQALASPKQPGHWSLTDWGIPVACRGISLLAACTQLLLDLIPAVRHGGRRLRTLNGFAHCHTIKTCRSVGPLGLGPLVILRLRGPGPESGVKTKLTSDLRGPGVGPSLVRAGSRLRRQRTTGAHYPNVLRGRKATRTLAVNAIPSPSPLFNGFKFEPQDARGCWLSAICSGVLSQKMQNQLLKSEPSFWISEFADTQSQFRCG